MIGCHRYRITPAVSSNESVFTSKLIRRNLAGDCISFIPGTDLSGLSSRMAEEMRGQMITSIAEYLDRTGHGVKPTLGLSMLCLKTRRGVDDLYLANE